MAPMTVAVESATTPAEAMTAASTRSNQKRVYRRFDSAPSKKTASRIAWVVLKRSSIAYVLWLRRATIAAVTRWISS
jgi:hypothetical protein